MKKNNSLLRVLMAMALVLVIIGTTAGCFGGGDKILVDQESYTCEYGEIFMVPFATCTNGEEVMVQIFDSEGYEVPVEYGTATLDLGEYKMVFTAGAVTKEVTITCVDTIAPQLFVSYTSSAAVGHWYELPAVTADDISGINASKTKVELYKAGQAEPVLSVPGERIRIEEAEYYTLKVSAEDKAGNVASLEKQIKVITRPESEVLQDFTTDPHPFHENTWGGNDPLYNWYEELDGREGVIALGASANTDGDWSYIWWTGLGMDKLDLVGATGFTIVMKTDNNRMLSIKPGFTGDTLDVRLDTDGEWVEYYISLVNADGVFANMSEATIGLAVAPVEKYIGEVAWIDEIIVHYTPYEEYTITVENGSVDYPYTSIPAGRDVVVTHDNSKTPAGKAFAYYEYNGERLWGGAFTVTENATLTAVYVDLVTEEKPAPEGATLVTDFSNPGFVEVDNNWGSNKLDISEWYATYDGVAGVRSLGFLPNSDFAYHRWSGILPMAFDYDSYTHLIFRMKVDREHLRALGVGDFNLIEQVNFESMVWVDVKVAIADLGAMSNIWIANTPGASGELVWLDAIYATVADLNVTVIDGTCDQGNNVAAGTTVTFTHDASKTPANCEFDYWIVNGQKIEGNTWVVTNDITVKAAYKSNMPELAIPEDSKMLADFSSTVVPHIPSQWGSGPAAAYYNTYMVKDDRAGVFAMGSNCESFMWYNAIGLNDMDLTGMDTITFRIKVKNSIRTLDAGVNDNMINLLSLVTVKDEWTEVTIKIADLNQADLSKVTIQFKFATWNEGETEYVWLDQVYASPKDPNAIDELTIPEGSKLISDFSKVVAPHIPNTWGSGPNGAYYNSYKELDGRAGVFAMGANAECFMWYNAVGLNDMDLTGMDTITFRLKVKGSIRTLQAGVNDNMIDLLSKVSVKGEWTEVTIKIADLNQADLSKVTIQFKFATWNEGETEYVWLDQVYASPKSGVEELAIPEGATMIADYSSTVTPHIPGHYGTPTLAYYTTYKVYEDRAGVFAMGSTGESFIWYNDFGLNDMDLTGKTTITFRLKVKGSLRTLDAGHNDNMIALLPLITVKDEWTEVTINIADLNQADIAKITIQFKIATWNEGETAFIWLDQVYAQ